VKQEDINLERGMHKLAEKALKGKAGSKGGRARKSRREPVDLPPYEKVMEAKEALQKICGSDPYLIKLDYALAVWIHNHYRQIPKSIRGHQEKPSTRNQHPEIYAELPEIKPTVKQRRFDGAYKLAEQRISTALDAALDASNWGTEKAKNKRA